MIFIMRDQLAKAIFSGVGLAGLLAGTSNIFNNERNARVNQDMQIKELEYKDRVLEFDKYRFEKEFELKQSPNLLTETIEKLGSTSQFTKENPVSKVSESSEMSVSSNIPSVLEWDHFLIDSNTQNMVHSLTYSYMCFSIVTLLATFNLVFNYLYSVFGDKMIENLPKWVHPIYLFFKKYLLISMTFDLSMIILSQFFSLALSLYFQIRGVQ